MISNIVRIAVIFSTTSGLLAGVAAVMLWEFATIFLVAAEMVM
uniref:Transmembrane protein n=1 Tax=Medicago truncatula TaxID=3880 RepID=A2Q5V8_MEDTR|nr:hypothetical protein MtrDRAFT_AC170580g3v1 [Medicago truncatula]